MVKSGQRHRDGLRLLAAEGDTEVDKVEGVRPRKSRRYPAGKTFFWLIGSCHGEDTFSACSACGESCIENFEFRIFVIYMNDVRCDSNLIECKSKVMDRVDCLGKEELNFLMVEVREIRDDRIRYHKSNDNVVSQKDMHVEAVGVTDTYMREPLFQKPRKSIKARLSLPHKLSTVMEIEKSCVTSISIEMKFLSSERNLVVTTSSSDRKLMRKQRNHSISVKGVGRVENYGSSSTGLEPKAIPDKTSLFDCVDLEQIELKKVLRELNIHALGIGIDFCHYRLPRKDEETIIKCIVKISVEKIIVREWTVLTNVLDNIISNLTLLSDLLPVDGIF
ncbi:hypothetical protein GIB67_003918 [Kingdonia uniflora]|uniref:Uncharacterized protein n=1 Tax=Kingdonia uniflora TaxID=39325 RepID=A0A7J7LK90_9MAGN|nr:hypothetical protein GIB67_003918 [Kingdonia uniflora]